MEKHTQRTMGLWGAVGLGVAAIVGGGILILGGVAFEATGPSAVLAFGLNGFLAILTVFSFAEMSAAFPESGGTYVFSKKVLSIRAAFGVGWIIWFASIVAAVLYALGAGFFIAIAVNKIWESYTGTPLEWVNTGFTSTVIAVIATLIYTKMLLNKQTGGGNLINIGKLAVFLILIIGGGWYISTQSVLDIVDDYTPFFTEGGFGLLQAMGYTFIAYHGFDLIAAVGGEVKDPERNIPRAMFISLIVAIVIYILFMLVITVAAVGPGESIAQASSADPEAIVMFAAEAYMGKFGLWLVIIAGILSMLSALYANLLGASHIAFSMAKDRTLPRALGKVDKDWGTPVKAILATAAVLVITIIIIPDVAIAGAASSLIFLVSFAIAHWISILSRLRSDPKDLPFKSPFFPLIPVVGILSCVGLAVFQGIKVPLAGVIMLVWLGLGGGLYYILFRRRARVVDASAEGYDPRLVSLRGRSPVVLVPIVNPSHAVPMVAVASALAPPITGRVLLLSVVRTPEDWNPETHPEKLNNTQRVLKESLSASFGLGLIPEVLTTVATEPWDEIIRVSHAYSCESLLLGLTNLNEKSQERIEYVMNRVDSDVVVLRTTHMWRLSEVKKILVPVRGSGAQDELLARLLGSICRAGNPEVTFLKVLPEDATWQQTDKARKALFQIAEDQVPHGQIKVVIVKNNNVSEEIISHAQDSDLMIVGLQRFSRRHKEFGKLPLYIAQGTDCPMLMISRKR
ncbi:MAG: amino acid permease [Candidatus Dadabacteria bacterium]|nr:MAG: amino acid permease [Candidatus Dadabacteria bacterium]